MADEIEDPGPQINCDTIVQARGVLQKASAELGGLLPEGELRAAYVGVTGRLAEGLDRMLADAHDQGLGEVPVDTVPDFEAMEDEDLGGWRPDPVTVTFPEHEPPAEDDLSELDGLSTEDLADLQGLGSLSAVELTELGDWLEDLAEDLGDVPAGDVELLAGLDQDERAGLAVLGAAETGAVVDLSGSIAEVIGKVREADDPVATAWLALEAEQAGEGRKGLVGQLTDLIEA